MNILYLCADRGIPVNGHKGAAVHVRAMCAAFTRAGHNVTLVTPRAEPAGGPRPAAELIAVPLPDLPAGAPDSAAARERQARAYNETLLAALQQLAAERPFDFIYERHSLWSDVGARLSGATGLPLVLEVNAPLRQEAAEYRRLDDPAAAARSEATQFRAAAAIAVVSAPLVDYAVRGGAPRERVHLLPNGVDPADFHPAVRGGRIRDQYNLHGRIVVGFAGRPRPWHDLATLLDAFGQLRAADDRYHLLLVGEMDAGAGLPAQLAAAGLTGAGQTAVTYTGPVPHTAVPEHLAAMNVAVSPHPARSDFYFSPLKLAEYLACGVPTVAADVGQLGELVRPGETGELYPPGDAAALAASIRRLVEDPARARRLAWQGAATVLANQTWDQHALTVTGWIRPAPLTVERAAPGRPAPVTLPILDQKLRQRLYRATRPDLAAPFFARYLPPFGKQGSETLTAVTQIEILKYKPGRRCVLAYELAGRSRAGERRPTQHRVIGKLFRDDRGERLYELQAALWRHGFGPEAPDQIHVPRPLAYIPKMRMLVQERARGLTLNELAERRWRQGPIDEPVIRCAAALARLHRVNPAWLSTPGNGHRPTALRPYRLADELANLDRFTAELAAVRPQSAAAVATLRDLLRDWAATLPPAPPPAVIHRDYYYSQMLFDGPRLTLIDFDLLAEGDPAIDVANFVAHLYFLGLDRLGSWHALAGEAERFLESYLDQASLDGGDQGTGNRDRGSGIGKPTPIPDPRSPIPDQRGEAFRRRCAFYQAATFFRLLNVVAPRPGLVHLFDELFHHTAAFMEIA